MSLPFHGAWLIFKVKIICRNGISSNRDEMKIQLNDLQANTRFVDSISAAQPYQQSSNAAFEILHDLVKTSLATQIRNFWDR